MNQEIAQIFNDMAGLLEIKGDSAFRINAYKKAAYILNSLQTDVSQIYKEKGLKGLKEIKGIGEGSAKRIEEYIKKSKIKNFEKLQEDAKKRKIIYSRYIKPAKQLLELVESMEGAKQAIDKVAVWANSRKLDY